MSFLQQGRGNGSSVVRTPAPPGSSPGPTPTAGLTGQFSREFSEVMQGRMTLLALDTIAVMLILFYLWTRRAQGGG